MTTLLSVLMISLNAMAFTPNERACQDLQKNLSKKKSIDVRVIFGYKDARPARYVGDRHERLAFVERIMKPCQGGAGACGFSRSPSDSDLFLKQVGASFIHLRVVNSSVGSDDSENSRDPFQMWKSQAAESAFLDGLKYADIVLYNGHSRFGGGPDFRAPVLARDGTVNARPYKSARSGLAQMLKALNGRRGPLVLGLYSCDSSQHFTKQLRAASPNTALITSPVLEYYSDALTDSLSTLDDLFARRCPKSLAFHRS